MGVLSKMIKDCKVLTPEGVEVFTDPSRGRALRSLKRYSKCNHTI